jgi:hypothetical protein
MDTYVNYDNWFCGILFMRLSVLALVNSFLYSMCYRNEVESSSDSDVDRYIINRKF